MKTQIVACKTLEQELLEAMRRAGTEASVVWLGSGLHNTPKKLGRVLLERIGQTDAERLLLCMGFCGNALLGLTTGDYELIVPRVDDCVSLLMGSVRARMEYSRAHAAYYMTEGWMTGERNLWTEHLHAVEKYGEETAMELASMLYAHYRTLTLLDTGTGDMDALLEKTEPMARTLGLEQRCLKVSLRYLEELLTGPWDPERFLIIPPNTTVTPELLSLFSETD